MTSSPVAEPGLGSLLHPISFGEFVDNYLGHQFLFVSGVHDRFTHLMPWNALNQILSYPGITKHVAIVREGKTIPFETYTESLGFDTLSVIYSRLSAPKVTNQLRDGATLVLNGIDKFYDPIRHLVHDLRKALCCNVSVNMYAAWRTSRGFNTHRDTHDVLVIQVHGKKHWSIYAEGEAGKPGPCVWERCVASGDVLYVPRGCWHLALPCDEPTLHLTVGLYSPQGTDLLRWAMRRVEQHELARQDVPLFATKRQASFLEALRDLLSKELSGPDVIDNFISRHTAELPSEPWFSLPWSPTSTGLPETTAFKIKLAVHPRSLQTRVIPESDEIEFNIRGELYRIGRNAAPLLDFLCDNESSVEDFVSSWSSHFDRDELKALLDQFIASGLITFREA